MKEMILIKYSYFFYKQAARELAPELAEILRHLNQGGNFPAYWRLAEVIPVPK